jgi:hypothetical protein
MIIFISWFKVIKISVRGVITLGVASTELISVVVAKLIRDYIDLIPCKNTECDVTKCI